MLPVGEAIVSVEVPLLHSLGPEETFDPDHERRPGVPKLADGEMRQGVANVVGGRGRCLGDIERVRQRGDHRRFEQRFDFREVRVRDIKVQRNHHSSHTAEAWDSQDSVHYEIAVRLRITRAYSSPERPHSTMPARTLIASAGTPISVPSFAEAFPTITPRPTVTRVRPGDDCRLLRHGVSFRGLRAARRSHLSL